MRDLRGDDAPTSLHGFTPVHGTRAGYCARHVPKLSGRGTRGISERCRPRLTGPDLAWDLLARDAKDAAGLIPVVPVQRARVTEPKPCVREQHDQRVVLWVARAYRGEKRRQLRGGSASSLRPHRGVLEHRDPQRRIARSSGARSRPARNARRLGALSLAHRSYAHVDHRPDCARGGRSGSRPRIALIPLEHDAPARLHPGLTSPGSMASGAVGGSLP